MAINVPGKILLYGGFSLLEKGNTALSLAVVDEDNNGVTAEYEEGDKMIVAPQFGIYSQPSLNDSHMVSFAYVFTEKYLSHCHKLKRYVKITLNNSPIFGTKENKIRLGSSAAATVAIVKALFEANGFDSSTHVETINKISQLAFSAYAKHVAPGYDIATSAFGTSMVYKRYDPSEIRIPASFDDEEIDKSIRESVNEPWEWMKTTPVDFPKQYKLIFFSIEGGKRSAKSSIDAVNEWKKSNPEEYKKTIKMQAKAETKAISYFLRHRSAGIRKYTHKIRDIQHALNQKMDATMKDFDHIEPEQIRNIIEETEKLEGIVVGKCPGEGGYSRLLFIAKRKFEDVIKIIEIGDKQGLKLNHIKLKVL
jgi:phosphomevalonate kinase